MAGNRGGNNEPQRDAGYTGSTGSHRSARRRYRRRVQLRPDPADQLAEHPGAFLTRGASARRPAEFPLPISTPPLPQPPPTPPLQGPPAYRPLPHPSSSPP